MLYRNGKFSTAIWINNTLNVYVIELDGKKKTITTPNSINYKNTINAYKKAGYKHVYISYVGKTNAGF